MYCELSCYLSRLNSGPAQPTMSALIDPHVDPHGYLAFKKNPDGTVTRLPVVLPEKPASADLTNPFHLSKDVTINQSKNTWVRILVPRKSFESNSGEKKLLPIVVYFHGGGFVLCSPATEPFYSIYDGLTTEIEPAIVVSVKYRLAPEHRLPAAYDDSMEALQWIKNSNDEWLTKYGDLSRCYLMGSSAGGNICYHAGLRAASRAADLEPLQIKGLILHHPFFGGQDRSDAEIRLVNDKILPPVVSDVMWDLSLPVGSDSNRDHEYCNPMVGMKTEIWDQIKVLGWKILITGCGEDPLIDRQIELVKKLEELGVVVVSRFEEKGCHNYDLHDPSGIKTLTNLVKEFIQSP